MRVLGFLDSVSKIYKELSFIFLLSFSHVSFVICISQGPFGGPFRCTGFNISKSTYVSVPFLCIF